MGIVGRGGGGHAPERAAAVAEVRDERYVAGRQHRRDDVLLAFERVDHHGAAAEGHVAGLDGQDRDVVGHDREVAVIGEELGVCKDCWLVWLSCLIDSLFD